MMVNRMSLWFFCLFGSSRWSKAGNSFLSQSMPIALPMAITPSLRPTSSQVCLSRALSPLSGLWSLSLVSDLSLISLSVISLFGRVMNSIGISTVALYMCYVTQLASLPLRSGPNKITFQVSSKFRGTQVNRLPLSVCCDLSMIFLSFPSLSLPCSLHHCCRRSLALCTCGKRNVLSSSVTLTERSLDLTAWVRFCRSSVTSGKNIPPSVRVCVWWCVCVCVCVMVCMCDGVCILSLVSLFSLWSLSLSGLSLSLSCLSLVSMISLCLSDPSFSLWFYLIAGPIREWRNCLHTSRRMGITSSTWHLEPSEWRDRPRDTSHPSDKS